MAEAILRLWDVGLDTWRISEVLGVPEPEIERELHHALEARRREREHTS